MKLKMKTNTHSWLDQNEYPFVSNYFKVNGTSMHYIDEGAGETLLFVHGTPSWSFDFRKLIKALSNQYRCIAIDHIGFGLSEKPVDYDYSTKKHAETLEAFIKRLQLKDITLVLHDFGGPIGFHYAVEHAANIKRMVVMNSWLWDSSQEPAFIKLSKTLKNPVLPFLYRYLNFSPRYLLPASFGEHKPGDNILEHYTRPFNNRLERNGLIAFARSLLNDQQWFEEMWKRKGVLSKKPLLLIWGMSDRFVTGNYLDKFISGFSNSYVKKLDTCGHFPQEECDVEVVQSLKYFLTKNNL